MFLLLEENSLFGAHHFLRRNNVRSKENRSYYGIKFTINVPYVRSFMGLIGYYKIFIEIFPKVAHPIASL